LKIARCQSDAQIESEKDISRYNTATVQDILACSVKAGCNATSLASILKNVANNNGHDTYNFMYNLCLQTSRPIFDTILQTYNGYWAQCTASNSSPNDEDVSGAEGVKVYSARVDCVNNLQQVKGL
jgi:hypothetical protein